MDNSKEIIEENEDVPENGNGLFDFKTTDHTIMLTPDAGAEEALTGLPQSSCESFNPVANLTFEAVQHSDSPIPSQTFSGSAIDFVVSAVPASESAFSAWTFEYPDPVDITYQ